MRRVIHMHAHSRRCMHEQDMQSHSERRYYHQQQEEEKSIHEKNISYVVKTMQVSVYYMNIVTPKGMRLLGKGICHK